MVLESKKFQITNESGLHARPISALVETINKYQSEVTLEKDGIKVNGKSIMGIMMLAAECGSEILVEAHGPDAQQVLTALEELIKNNFYEE